MQLYFDLHFEVDSFPVFCLRKAKSGAVQRSASRKEIDPAEKKNNFKLCRLHCITAWYEDAGTQINWSYCAADHWSESLAHVHSDTWTRGLDEAVSVSRYTCRLTQIDRYLLRACVILVLVCRREMKPECQVIPVIPTHDDTLSRYSPNEKPFVSLRPFPWRWLAWCRTDMEGSALIVWNLFRVSMKGSC